MNVICLVLTSAALVAVNIVDAAVRKIFTAVAAALAFAASAVLMLLLEASLPEVLLVVLVGACSSAGARLLFGRRKDR